MIKTLASFIDELQKISAATNVASVMSGSLGRAKSVQNVMGKPAFSKPNVQTMRFGSRDMTAKPTNYSIVNTEAPTAAYDAAATSKSVPPPPVRT
jgi:hypothetical protein